jgi:hypothetical protein
MRGLRWLRIHLGLMLACFLFDAFLRSAVNFWRYDGGLENREFGGFLVLGFLLGSISSVKYLAPNYILAA